MYLYSFYKCWSTLQKRWKSYIAHLETMKFFLLVFWIILLCILRYINFCRFIIPSTSTWNHFYKGITPQNYKKCITIYYNQLTLLIAWSNCENNWSHKMWNHRLLEDECNINAENYLIKTWPKNIIVFFDTQYMYIIMYIIW